MMTLKQLQCFITVVKTGGFSHAADTLSLTQPTVTKAISNLEDTLGVALFDKQLMSRKRDIALTEIGALVYEQAQTVLQHVGYLEQTVTQYQHMDRGQLRLGLSPLGGELLSDAIFEFYQTHRHIELSLLEDGAESLKQALLDDTLDVCTLMQPIEEDFDCIPVCDYPIMMVAHRQHMGNTIKQVTLKSLKNASLMLFASHSSFTSMIVEECQKLGFEPNIICHTNQWQLLTTLLKKNMGVTLLPKYYTDKLDDKQLVCLPLVQPNLTWQMVMAWRKHRPLTPAMQAWLNVVQRQANNKV